MKIKNFFKTSVAVAAVSLLIVGLFMLYFYTVGIPKIQVRTYYNLAISELEEGNREDAKAKLQIALDYWKEGYIQEKLKEIQ